MKQILNFAAILFLMSMSLTASAQQDERTKGIYAIVNGESIPLSFTYGTGGGDFGTGAGIGNVSMNIVLAKSTFHYKGVHSGIVASDTFVLVVDPKKNSGIITPKKFDYFIKKMTPNDMIVVPVFTNEKKQRREFDPGTIVDMLKHLKDNYSEQFQWTKISDNSFEIKVNELTPGEYGIVFRIPGTMSYSFDHLFGFTIQ